MALGTTATFIAFYKMLMAAGLTASAAGLIDEYQDSLSKKIGIDEAKKEIDLGFKSYKTGDENLINWTHKPTDGSIIGAELETFLGMPIEEFMANERNNATTNSTGTGTFLGKPIEETQSETNTSTGTGTVLDKPNEEPETNSTGTGTFLGKPIEEFQTENNITGEVGTGGSGNNGNEENLDEKAQAGLQPAPENEGIKDETSSNIEFNMTEYINWAEQQQLKEWEREDQLRKEDWARQDSAYTRMVQDLQKSGANPNLMIQSGASPVSQNSVQSGSSQLNTAVLTEELGNQMELLKQTFENNFKGSEAEKDRFIDIWNTILQTIGFMVAIKGKN